MIFLSLSVVSAHDGRLDDRDQRHVGVGSHGDRSQELRLAQLGAQEDGGRAVRAADDGDGGSGLAVEAQGDGAEIGGENAELSCCAEQEAHGIGDQGTEVRHGPDAHEDQGRQDRPFVKLEEIVQKSAR